MDGLEIFGIVIEITIIPLSKYTVQSCMSTMLPISVLPSQNMRHALKALHKRQSYREPDYSTRDIYCSLLSGSNKPVPEHKLLIE